MPSLSDCSTTVAMDNTNRTSLINAMLLRAWRERWDDSQWGTYIKTVCFATESAAINVNNNMIFVF